jgi:hypothetical protein
MRPLPSRWYPRIIANIEPASLKGAATHIFKTVAVIMVVGGSLIGVGCSGGSSSPKSSTPTRALASTPSAASGVGTPLPTPSVAPAVATPPPGLATPLAPDSYLGAFSLHYVKIATSVQHTIQILQASFDRNDPQKVSDLKQQFQTIRNETEAVRTLFPPPPFTALHQAFLDSQTDYEHYIDNFERFLDTGAQDGLDMAAAFLASAQEKAKLVRDLYRAAALPGSPVPAP